eukprot:GHVS01000961.1.p1 GENE.GHVS01000961.1~~GHVS01000961.1.p1  ORF type:complete len:131 (+),score=14.58 GHVS01000961.1:209-601(+)
MTAAYLNDGFLGELRGYARLLANEEEDWIDTLAKYLYSSEDVPFRAGLDEKFRRLRENVFYRAYQQQTIAKEIRTELKYAFSFTMMFAAVAEKLETIQVPVDREKCQRWMEYLEATDKAKLSKYIEVTGC